MKKIFLGLVIFSQVFSLAAQDLNNYKYIIIPEKFEFAKEENQYQINSLAKFLFEKEGIETLMKKEERPGDLQQDHCLGLTANVENNSGLFVTRFIITLEDCSGNVVFTSEEGTSREKDYKAAWHEALRDAFTSVQAMGYNFNADALPTDPDPSDKTEPEAGGEVGKATPEMEKDAPEIPETDKAPVPSEDAKTPSDPKLNFVKDDREFYLEETNNGYRFYQKDMAEPFAVLVKSGEGEDYLYNAISKQGKAYFAQDGNLIVEHFDPASKELVKTTYVVKEDQ